MVFDILLGLRATNNDGLSGIIGHFVGLAL